MTKRFNQQNFYIELTDGRTIGFYCWTTKTRYGHCQTCWCVDNDKTSKSSYSNRPWEEYRYQTVLLSSFNKWDKEVREQLIAWDKAKTQKDHEDCENFVNTFKAVYDATPQSFKDTLANSDIMLESQEQANVLMGAMKLATVMNK